VYRSSQYATWRTAAIWQLSVQAQKEKIAGPYKLTMLVVRPDKRKRDLDNLFKAASDALVGASILEDHNCEWLEARWVPTGPQCELIVEELEGENYCGND